MVLPDSVRLQHAGSVMGMRPKRVKRKRVEHRGNSTERGYDAKWQKISRAFRKAQPNCAECGVVNEMRRMVVDHIVPHRGDRKIFWDPSNWQTLCQTCHNKKTARGE